jgi:hypothetical protein
MTKERGQDEDDDDDHDHDDDGDDCVVHYDDDREVIHYKT